MSVESQDFTRQNIVQIHEILKFLQTKKNVNMFLFTKPVK